MAEGDALIIDEASREVIARLVAEKRRLLDAAPRLDAHRLHGDVAEPSAAPMATSSTFVRAARGAMADDCASGGVIGGVPFGASSATLRSGASAAEAPSATQQRTQQTTQQTTEPTTQQTTPPAAPLPRRRLSQSSSLSSLHESSTMAQLRAQRLQQEMLSREMQQCTFTPRTNSRQPFRVVSDPEAFYERTQKWRESKEAQLIVRKQQAVEHQLEDCTFRPTPVARRRSSAARSPHAELREGSAHARVGRAPSDGDGEEAALSFVDRLYRPQRAQELDFSLIRRHTPFSPYVAPRFPHMSEINCLFSFLQELEAAARDARAALAAEEQKHCPFAPKMNGPYRPRGSERAVGSRYRSPRRAPAATANHGETFTFTPTVNQLPKRLSKGAAKYLESPAHERLSSMVSRGARRKEQLVEGAGEGKEEPKQRDLTRSLSLGSLRTRQPSHPHDQPLAAPAAPAAPGAGRAAAISAGALPAVPSATMSSRVATDPPGAGCAPRAFSSSPAFSSYLERLEQYQARKVEAERVRTEDAEREQASLSRLTLSRGTRALMAKAEAAAKGEGRESLLHGSFLERAERAAERRPSPQSAQFTFTPRINPGVFFSFFLFSLTRTHSSHMSEPILPISHL